MRKHLKNIFGTAIFLIIGLILLILVSYTLRPTDKNFFRSRMVGFYAEEEDSLDIVGYGSSALYRYINSPQIWREQGLTSYMIATAAQPIYLTETLIDETLKTQSPKLLLIETRRFITTKTIDIPESRFRPVVDNMKYSWNRFSAVNKLIGDIDNNEDKLSYYFDLVKYHGNWETLSRKSLSYMFNEKDHTLKSWSMNKKHKLVEYRDVSHVTEEMPISEQEEATLRSIMAKCKKAGVDIIFVATPWQATEEDQMQDNYMKRVVEEEGYQFLDCNSATEEIGLDYSVDFYNPKHTNVVGAAKVTRYVGEYIAEHYDIQTEHSEKVCADWDKAAEEEAKEYKEAEAVILEKAKLAKEQKSAEVLQ